MNGRTMRMIWLVLALALGLVRGAESGLRASKPEVRKEVVQAIEGQLAAFRVGERQKAYAFAAANLRAQRPMRQFLLIVENNYPEIWANTRAEFGLVRDDGARAAVRVQVFSNEGRADYDYGLVKERDGVWRIDSVLRHAPKKSDRV